MNNGAPSRGRGGWNNRNPYRWMYAKSRGSRGYPNANSEGRGSFRGRGGERGGRNEIGSGGSSPGGGLPLMPLPPFRGGLNSGNEEPYGTNGSPPTPTHSVPTRKRKSVSSIKAGLLTAWKKKLPGYCLYYPDSPPQLPDVDKKILIITEYLGRNGYLVKPKLLDIEEKEYFEVICEQVLRDPILMEQWPDFMQDLGEEPGEVVNLWGAVMHKIVYESVKEDEEAAGDEADPRVKGANGKLTTIGRIHSGLMKAEPVIPLIRINSSLIGKFVTIRGAVVGAGTVRAVCLQLAFLCKICQTEFLVDQPHGMFTLPTRCGVSEDCDNKKFFEPVESSSSTLMMDARRIKIQDVQHHNIEKGSVPKTIECELTNGLVYQCNTGDSVTLTGIVKMKKEFHFNGEQSLHNFYIETVAMRNHKESKRTMGGHWFSLSNKDYCAIREIHDTPNLFRLMTASLCPSIYGHELVKASLILSLFGGASHGNDDMLSRRSDINILMIGDPGIGKSQMLKVITEVAPRGVYVCGTGSTVAGLTVTLVRDGDEYSLEAGALIMADQGVCCIDEFDKMIPQHPALLEAMEQQSVSIAKSGVFRTLPARTTVIAAANPVGGHYDRRKSVSENIKISSALLSRFDVTFILLDKPNKDFDQKLVEHILGFHKIKNPVVSRASTSSGYCSIGNTQESGMVCPDTPLIDRLKFSCDEEKDLIPHSLIRKYIAYARQYVQPKISPEAAAILKEYYMKLRVKHRMQDSTPITTRQLESLIRLTEARAKVELREIASADDAKDVLQIFESSLSSAFDDEVVAVSALSQSILVGTPVGTGKSQTRNQAKNLVAALQRSAQQQCKNIFTVNEITQIIQFLRLRSPPDALIAMLNNEGYLLKKGGCIYQLTVADF